MDNKKRTSLKDFHKKLKIKMIKKASKTKMDGRIGIIGLAGA